MTVYRGMDVGTAKPTPEDRARVAHAMVDVADPEEPYSVARFQREARAAMVAWDGPVLLVGGSGLHMRAVVDPLRFPPSDASLRAEIEDLPDEEVRRLLLAADPSAGDHVDLANRRRTVRALEILRLTGMTPSARAADPLRRAVAAYEPEIPFTGFGVDPGARLPERVAARVEGMRRRGLLAEVASLRSRLGPTASEAVGYRQLIGVVDGKTSVEEGFAAVHRATLALAKRQRTFFRRDPRISWLPDPPSAAERLVTELESECAS